jgi:hypothetical protein
MPGTTATAKRSAQRRHHRGDDRTRPYERTARVVDAFFDLADAIITLRSLIRQAWTSYRWDTHPAKRP